MLRSEMIAGIRVVDASIQKSGVANLLGEAVHIGGRGASEFAGNYYKSFAVLYSESQDYGEIERRLVSIFELGIIFNEPFWEALSKGDDTREVAINAYTAVKNFQQFSPRILELLARPGEEGIEAQDSQVDEEHPEIQIYLPETGNSLSKATRVVEAIAGLNSLYGAICQVESIDDKELVITNCDSGSDFLFTFLGIGKGITALKETLFELWDRVVFHKERRLGNDLGIVVQSLSVLEKVEASIKNGSCAPEQGELLKRTIIQGTTKLLDSGAILPEFEQRSHVDVRQIMAPSPLMLTEPRGEIDQDVDGKNQPPIGESQDGELTAKDEHVIQEAMRRIKAEQAEQAEEDQDTGQVKKKREKRPPKK